MAGSRVVNIPLVAGRKDSVDPKFAPLGALATCQNLRVQKDGRLISRTGYLLQGQNTASGSLVSYDLHEYQGRLLALGTDLGDGYPIDVFEFIHSSLDWRGSDPSKTVVLNPFTNLRSLPSVQQIPNGTGTSDVAAGGGFAALVYKPAGSTFAFVSIVRQSDGQVIHQENMIGSVSLCRCTWSVDTFYFIIAQSTGNVEVRGFTPGVSTSTTFPVVTVVAGGTVANVIDIVPVTNGSTGRFITGFGKAADTRINRYQSTGVQIGATIVIAVVLSGSITIEGDQVDNTINFCGVVGGNAQLRTFNFTTGALTLGPTAVGAGTTASMCRLPVLGANAQSIATAVNTATGTLQIELRTQAAHTLTNTVNVGQVLLQGRLCEGQSGTQNRCVVFSGLVAPDILNAINTGIGISNALFFIGLINPQAHMMTRDYTRSLGMQQHNLQLDTSTGKLAWLGCNNPAGDLIPQPSISMVDFRATKRRQGARYASLLYFAGGTVQVYDGTIPCELFFNELPGIISATPAAGGALTASAQYDYVHHWEYIGADGSLQESEPSAVFAGNTGGAQTQNTLVVTTPHSMRIALSSSLLGAGAISVLSRTVWDATTSTKGSQFRRCVTQVIPGGMANYGQTLSIVDQRSDATLATQGVVYTQGSTGALSGPLPNNAPEACSYIVADASRLFLGGLNRQFETQVSMGTDIEKPFRFSELSPFFNQVSEPVIGVSAFDSNKLVFTVNQLFALGREGPDDQGGGALDPPQEIPTPAGLQDWRSLLKVPDGLYFQLDDSKLYKLPEGGQSPFWAAVDIQDVLTAFPVITGAARCKQDDTAVFACGNTGLTSSSFIVQSLRTGVWTVDTVPLSGGVAVAALTNFGDTVAYVSGGRVFTQDAAIYSDTSNTVITCQWKTHPIYPFELGGWGEVVDLLVSGEFRSAGTLALRVSYDDGVSFTTYPSFVITGLTVGATVQKKWALTTSDTTSLVMEWTFTPSSPGAGLILHSAALLVNQEAGKLRELNPGDQA